MGKYPRQYPLLYGGMDWRFPGGKAVEATIYLWEMLIVIQMYRCYYVWNRNIWVVALPGSLVVVSIGQSQSSIQWRIFSDP